MLKKIFCVLTVVLIIASVCGCANNVDAPADSSVAVESSEPEKVIIPPVINGNSLSDYTIVYRAMNNATQTDACRDSGLVNVIRKYFKETYGEVVKAAPDSATESEKEIILGKIASREISKGDETEYGYGGYKVVISGDKIWISGDYATGIYQGFEALTEMFNESEDGVFTDTEFSGEGEVIRVAAIGDSITIGVNSNDYEKTYPTYIQQMLGYDYYVANLGVNGSSICTIDPYSYAKFREYTIAKMLKPDVVLFALGTNDANPGAHTPSKDWTNPANNRVEVFKRDTKAMWDTFKSLNPDVQIFVILPASLIDCPAGQKWDPVNWTANIVEYSHPLLKELAEEYSLDTVDMFPWSVENPEVFTDGLHPYKESYKDFAQYIYENIADKIVKPE